MPTLYKKIVKAVKCAIEYFNALIVSLKLCINVMSIFQMKKRVLENTNELPIFAAFVDDKIGDFKQTG